MREYTERLLKKAERAIGSVGTSFRLGDHEAAINRAYYAMFYTAQALLYERGYSFSKHAGVQSALGQHLIKAGLLDRC